MSDALFNPAEIGTFDQLQEAIESAAIEDRRQLAETKAFADIVRILTQQYVRQLQGRGAIRNEKYWYQVERELRGTTAEAAVEALVRYKVKTGGQSLVSFTRFVAWNMLNDEWWDTYAKQDESLESTWTDSEGVTVVMRIQGRPIGAGFVPGVEIPKHWPKELRKRYFGFLIEEVVETTPCSPQAKQAGFLHFSQEMSFQVIADGGWILGKPSIPNKTPVPVKSAKTVRQYLKEFETAVGQDWFTRHKNGQLGFGRRAELANEVWESADSYVFPIKPRRCKGSSDVKVRAIPPGPVKERHLEDLPDEEIEDLLRRFPKLNRPQVAA